jgi:hypothetical protein
MPGGGSLSLVVTPAALSGAGTFQSSFGSTTGIGSRTFALFLSPEVPCLDL